MITAKEAKQMMPDAHIKYKKELLDFTTKDIEKQIRSSVDRFKLAATIKVSFLIRNEVIDLLEKSGYKVISNGSDELIVDWSEA